MKTRVEGRHMPPLAFAVMIGLVLLAPVAHAQTTRYVDAGYCPNSGTGTPANPFCTIQEGIDAAVDGDEVLVRPGVYNEAIDFIGKSITLRSQDGKDTTILDGTGLTDPVISCHTTATFTIDGFAVRHGAPGLYFDYFRCSATVQNSLFEDNSVATRMESGFLTLRDSSVLSNGGGIGCFNFGAVTAERCRFEGNHGAIYCYGCGGSITDSSFVGNSQAVGASSPAGANYVTITDTEFIGNGDIATPYGGALVTDYTAAIVTGCRFERNSAQHGGAVYMYEWDNLYDPSTYTDCVFEENTATEDGGAVYADAGSYISTFEHCTFTHNRAGGSGGAIAAYHSPALRYLTFEGNSAVKGGAIAVFADYQDIGVFGPAIGRTCFNCLFVGNTASDAGGVLHMASGASAGFSRSTLVANEAPNGNAVATDSLSVGPSDVSFGTSIVRNGGNEIWNNDGSTITVNHCDITGGYAGTGNIDADPLFEWDPNGGGDGWGDDPSTTGIDEGSNDDFGNLRLREGSPCVDAGVGVANPDPTDVDLDGNPRYADDGCTPDTGTGPPPIMDIGAYERVPCYDGRSRYLKIRTALLGSLTDVGLRITCTNLDGFTEFNGAVLWAGPQTAYPDENTDDPGATFLASGLQCEPYYADWGTQARLVVFGAEIVPNSTYLVEVVPNGGGEPTASTTVNTGVWGDVVRPFIVDSQPQPDFTDISSLVAKFLADPTAPPKADAQLVPNVVLPNRPIDFNDISADVGAFLGDPFAAHPDATGPCTCPSDVTCGAASCQSDGQCGAGFCIDGSCTDPCGRCAP